MLKPTQELFIPVEKYCKYSELKKITGRLKFCQSIKWDIYGEGVKEMPCKSPAFGCPGDQRRGTNLVPEFKRFAHSKR